VGDQQYKGRWYSEYPESIESSDEEWASVSNYRSFWLTEESLLTAASAAGFKKIYKVHGGFGIETEMALSEKYSRGYWIALNEEYGAS
jgi:hypothetical protein